MLLLVVPTFGWAAISPPSLRLTPSCAASDSAVWVETNLWPRVLHDRVIHQVYLDYLSPSRVELFPTPDTTGQADYSTYWARRVNRAGIPGGSIP